MRLHVRKGLRVAVQMAMALVVLLFSLNVAANLEPAPILPKPYARTFLELKEKSTESARLWPWWDYGYAGQYYAERMTFGDGGRHKGNILYPAARVHMTHSPRQARQLMQYITISQQQEFAANSTKYEDMNEFWKPYLTDPGRIQQVRGEVGFDLDRGQMELEGGTLELSGLSVLRQARNG